MNDGQKKFLGFILDRVKEDKKQEAEALLAESFGKQKEGTFNKEYLMSFIPKMMSCIREDKMEEVKNIMMNYRDQH